MREQPAGRADAQDLPEGAPELSTACSSQTTTRVGTSVTTAAQSVVTVAARTSGARLAGRRPGGRPRVERRWIGRRTVSRSASRVWAPSSGSSGVVGIALTLSKTGRPVTHPGRPILALRLLFYSALTRSRIRLAVSVGVLPTRTPTASSASFFASAVPAEPEMIAPACPMVLPGGAVKPAM